MKKLIFPLFYTILLFTILTQFLACGSEQTSDELASGHLSRSFDGGYGQLEVGGPFVGAEFHGSQPVPTRLSFYYPVANSLDLSRDYWTRYNSHPLHIVFHSIAGNDTIGQKAWGYKYGPTHATFSAEFNGHEITLGYQFGETLPIMAMSLEINSSESTNTLDSIEVIWDLSIRTCHAYRWVTDITPEITSKRDFAVSYSDTGAANAALFIANFKASELSRKLIEGDAPKIGFNFDNGLSHSTLFSLTQVIGMCPSMELDSILAGLGDSWQNDIKAYEQRVSSYALNRSSFTVADPELQETIYWSKALQASNKHYIDGRIMPMPCPAEYNFFFTHDMLLTGQGNVNFDLSYLRDGFDWLIEHTLQDSIIPHAYYWREGEFVTEYCNSDNWNHLWFVISTASYLKHSADNEMVEILYPMLQKSIALMYENLGDDGLMYAKHPDGWDIGNVYGPRSYITILMSKALRDFVFISASLHKDLTGMAEHLALADELKQELNANLWNEDARYLLNILDQDELDTHYYTGSMLGVVYDMLDDHRSERLLQTVKDTLLDPQLGVRNVMPPDFHLLGDRYHFQGNEAGDPWVYANGGVWPQGNAWYVKALHANGQVEEALGALKKYMTIAGILNSPNGLPSFYEYRRSDPDSPRYGEIDKPSFLWAGGFYLQSIYQLAGYREDDWNQYFDVNIPQSLSNAEFDLNLAGKLCRVQNHGAGKWFEQILVDGVPSYSAIVTGPAKSISLKRGELTSPYLSSANCMIKSVTYGQNEMIIELEGLENMKFKLNIASPKDIKEAAFSEIPDAAPLEVAKIDDSNYAVLGVLHGAMSRIKLSFSGQ
ncbi:MAG: hypothetical protein K9N29_08225 [Candidatus Marinimicrobia bacterium]|nr:hypothetical protein [Candidatus Neomarinimicrobiota bacterium]